MVPSCFRCYTQHQVLPPWFFLLPFETDSNATKRDARRSSVSQNHSPLWPPRPSSVLLFLTRKARPFLVSESETKIELALMYYCKASPILVSESEPQNGLAFWAQRTRKSTTAASQKRVPGVHFGQRCLAQPPWLPITLVPDCASPQKHIQAIVCAAAASAAGLVCDLTFPPSSGLIICASFWARICGPGFLFWSA